MSNLTCHDGLLVPALSVSTGHALLYVIGLLYTFLGVSIAVEVFMCAIEKITSVKRKVRRPRERNSLTCDGLPDDDGFVEVKVWNPTVANLTIMVIGSSAPEILLSTIEIVGRGFQHGELGPGTIVGSAAFNLFCVTSICVLAVTSPKGKRVELFRVFAVTATFCTFAYIWLWVILTIISPEVIEIWEAAVTISFFAALVIVAYLADIQACAKGTQTHGEQQQKMADELNVSDDKHPNEGLDANIKRYASEMSLQSGGANFVDELPIPSPDVLRAFSRVLRKSYPTLSQEEQAKILAFKLHKSTPRTRLHYQLKAARIFSSGLKNKSLEHEVEKSISRYCVDSSASERRRPQIEFSARVYVIDPTDKQVTLSIVRRGTCRNRIVLNYCTQSGIAKKNVHFLPKSETIRMEANETTRDVTIELMPEADWLPNHVFYVNLKIQEHYEGDETVLGPCSKARVRYTDEVVYRNSTPTVEFVKTNYIVSENCGLARLLVAIRGRERSGEGGNAVVFYDTADITAQSHLDYVPVNNGRLEFRGQEYEKFIDIEIIDDKIDEKDETFSVQLSVQNKDILLGRNRRAIVTIVSDDNVLSNVANLRRLMQHHMTRLSSYRSSWMEQIREAVSVNSGDAANATLCECLIHAIAFPWKFVFSLVPPPALLSGWLAFVIVLALTALLTAIIHDLASIFGCMVGLSDTVTAITFVALGTSSPDTFASRLAAKEDDTADNAIGHITGANSVNVFIGLGLPWLLASIYWTSKGKSFAVPADNLGFSVALFVSCSMVFLMVLILRRTSPVFGRAELGGPFGPKVVSALLLLSLWVIYIALSIWNNYRMY